MNGLWDGQNDTGLVCFLKRSLLLAPGVTLLSDWSWLDAICRHKFFGIGISGRDAGGGDGFAALNFCGHFLVQREKLGEQIAFGGEAVGGEDGGVQCGVGVFQRICAGQFEGAIKCAQAALHFRQRLGAHAAQLARRRCHGVNLLHRRRLRLRECVENGFGAVTKANTKFAALGNEPKPVRVRLHDAETIIVCETKNLNQVARTNY